VKRSRGPRRIHKVPVLSSNRSPIGSLHSFELEQSLNPYPLHYTESVRFFRSPLPTSTKHFFAESMLFNKEENLLGLPGSVKRPVRISLGLIFTPEITLFICGTASKDLPT
jgi:hypothetical protein